MNVYYYVFSNKTSIFFRSSLFLFAAIFKIKWYYFRFSSDTKCNTVIERTWTGRPSWSAFRDFAGLQREGKRLMKLYKCAKLRVKLFLARVRWNNPRNRRVYRQAWKRFREKTTWYRSGCLYQTCPTGLALISSTRLRRTAVSWPQQ